MTRYANSNAQQKVLALITELADGMGIARNISLREIQRLSGVPWSSASVALKHLVEAGHLARLVKGSGRTKAIYRVCGKQFVSEKAAEPFGLESVVRMTPDRNYLGSPWAPAAVIPISLARVRCLEGVGE